LSFAIKTSVIVEKRFLSSKKKSSVGGGVKGKQENYEILWCSDGKSKKGQAKYNEEETKQARPGEGIKTSWSR